jgi:large subunit ribosomal protein L23
MQINHIVIAPVITEKATHLAQGNVYTFQVAMKANKDQIKHALEQLYKVKVGEIKTVTREGKMRRAGKKMQPTMTADKKIAYVTVKEGKIDLFPQA